LSSGPIAIAICKIVTNFIKPWAINQNKTKAKIPPPPFDHCSGMMSETTVRKQSRRYSDPVRSDVGENVHSWWHIVPDVKAPVLWLGWEIAT
jgi:hypothetical protein